jgi:hypothetical protein
MPRYYFHLSNSHELITDNIGSEVSDVAAAHRRAVQLADRVVSFSGLADREPDWRRWIVRVTDQSQLPIVTVIFPACFMTEKQGAVVDVKGARALQTFLDTLVPISDEQAKAIQEALKTLQGVGGFLREMCGTVPEDVVALLSGNWLNARRAENLLRTVQRAHERLKKDGIKPEAASLSIGLPVLIAAADESRDELQDLWARLLAAAADPARSKSFRNAYIEVIKKMDPLDAAVIQAAQAEGGRIDGGKVNSMAARLTLSNDQVGVSVENLEKLGILIWGPAMPSSISPFGREFLRVTKL